MQGRFDYVKFDEESTRKQEDFKLQCIGLEGNIEDELKPGRARSLALTKLEEMYMWFGKAIRDEQVERRSQPEHLPERSDT